MKFSIVKDKINILVYLCGNTTAYWYDLNLDGNILTSFSNYPEISVVAKLGNYFPPAPGCTDSTAVNYDPTATVSDSSCVYSPLSLDPVSDTLCLGDTIIISWTGGDPNDPIYISLANNTAWAAVFSITKNLPNTGSYSWVVQGVPPGPGDLYQFYIQNMLPF